VRGVCLDEPAKLLRTTTPKPLTSVRGGLLRADLEPWTHEAEVRVLDPVTFSVHEPSRFVVIT